MNNKDSDDVLFKALLFEKNGHVSEVLCRIVDVKTAEFDVLFESATLCRKRVDVQARQATGPEKIETKLDATQNQAESGDWIVTNPGGEVYVLKAETFAKTYLAKEGKNGWFESAGLPVKAVQIDQNIVFTAPWGNEQGLQAGGYLIERQDNKDRYGVDADAFAATYEAIQSSTLN